MTASFSAFVVLLLTSCFCRVIVSGKLDQDDTVIVNTLLGPVKGIATSFGRSFLGIPFAAPPIGDGRFAPPMAVSSWNPNIYNATAWKPGCPQDCVLPPHTCPVVTSEDCLYLNIYTPSIKYLQKPQPVMLFLHGGRFEQGAAGTLLYDGSVMSNWSNCIVVTANYRLGALGWLALNSTFSGNWGIMDQRASMQWIQNNIENFGGDPNQVTLFGQSAGATSTIAHVISQLSQGLFQQAIVESDPFTLPMKPLADASALGQLFAKDAGCDDIDCLRRLPVEAILEAQNKSQVSFNWEKPLELFLPWTPTVDGEEFTEQSLASFAQGEYTPVPMMIGTVSEEALIFIYKAASKSVTDAEYLALLADVFLEEAPFVADMYPPDPIIGDKRPLVSVLGTDYIFVAPTRNAADNMENSPSVYMYQFTHAMVDDIWGPDYQFCAGHVCHGSELPFVFHPMAFNFTEEEETLSYTMMSYWTNFARNGDPNVGNSVDVKWPQFDVINRQYINLTTPITSNADLRGQYCDFWDGIGYGWGW